MTVMLHGRETTFEDCVGFAADCFAEVDAQLYPMKGWMGESSVDCEDLRWLELDSDTKTEILADLEEKASVYNEFIENIQSLLSASEDVLKGINGAIECASQLEDEEE